MSTEVSPVDTPAKKSGSFNTGCVPVLLVLVAMLAVGLIWEAVAPGNSHTRRVSRSDYGTMWPLTVDSATIGCGDGRDPYVQVGTIRYGLTGAAKADGYTDVGPIWADDPASPGLKVSIGTLSTAALKLC